MAKKILFIDKFQTKFGKTKQKLGEIYQKLSPGITSSCFRMLHNLVIFFFLGGGQISESHIKWQFFNHFIKFNLSKKLTNSLFKQFNPICMHGFSLFHLLIPVILEPMQCFRHPYHFLTIRGGFQNA